MTLHVEISPEREAALRAEAQMRGVEVEELARQMIEHPNIPPSRVPLDPALRRRLLKELAEIGADLEPNPEETYSRETIYFDHD
jgi:hypothetical protein